MGSEKRKATHEWTDVTVLREEGRRGLYLAAFSGVIPPNTTIFREYKRKRGDNYDVILHGETERIEFEGRTTTQDDHCQYSLCF